MAKLIESTPLYRLAQEKAKDPKILFESHKEIANKCPISQIMYFAFLYIEGLYQEQKIDLKTRKQWRLDIENKLQDLAFQVYCERDMLQQYEKELEQNLRDGNFKAAVKPALHIADYYKTHKTFERFSELLKHYEEKNKPEPSPQDWEL